MSKVNAYSRRGMRLKAQAETYEHELLSLTRQKISKYDLFILNTIESIKDKIETLTHQSDVAKAKGRFLTGMPCKEHLLTNWLYYINLKNEIDA